MQVPSNALLNYVGRPSIYIGTFVSNPPLVCPHPASILLFEFESTLGGCIIMPCFCRSRYPLSASFLEISHSLLGYQRLTLNTEQTIIWGLVSACTSQVKTPADIIACRFVLGFVEAPFFPGVLFYLSKWYTKKELSLRMAVFYSGSLISGAFGNLMAAGILNGLAGARGYAAWQWLYIIEGSITICVSSDTRHNIVKTPIQMISY